MQSTLRAPCPTPPRHAVVWAPSGGRALAGQLHRRVQQHHLLRCQALGGEPSPEEGEATAAAGPSGRTSREELLATLDPNQLQTALLAAVAAEKYELASKIRDLLALVSAGGGGAGPGAAARPADWEQLGVLHWLAERAESLGYRMPTEVQRRAAPVILSGSDCVIRSQTGSGKTLSFLLATLSALGYPPDLYPDDLKGPQAVIVVPTRELGVQVVMLIFRLFGGSVNQGLPGAGANMFTYQGPRGIAVKGLLLEDEVEAARQDNSLGRAHVVVGTPPLIAAAMAAPGGVGVASYSRVVVVDEVDACFQAHEEEMGAILTAACAQASKPTVVFVGATVGQDLVETAAAAGWVREPVEVAVGEAMRVPAGLSHRFIRVTEEGRRLVAMARQIRQDLQAQGQDAPPARVMVFAGSEGQAAKLAGPLRSVLWGEHRVSVLLPAGEEPIKAMHAFRDNAATLLLATPAAARGLDLPAVSHVYNVTPPADATDYLHRAGRLGRIGCAIPGVVTTMVTDAEVGRLQALAAELGLELEEAREPAALAGEGSADLDRVRRGLDDIFTLSDAS